MVGLRTFEANARHHERGFTGESRCMGDLMKYDEPVWVYGNIDTCHILAMVNSRTDYGEPVVCGYQWMSLYTWNNMTGKD